MSLRTRRRRPLKPATIDNWQFALDKWILPHLGSMQVADVSNAALKLLIDKMVAANLSEKSIVNYTQPVKMVVASAVNENGEQIYPRQWNHDFVEMPIVQAERQHRPAFTRALAEKVLAAAWAAKRQFYILFALLAGSGLRIGEALALRPEDFSQDCRIVYVRKSVYKAREQKPKTESSERDVDIAEPLARVMREYIKGKRGYLFHNRYGAPLLQSNIIIFLHEYAGEQIGFHAFRRFRVAVFEAAGVPDRLQDIWLGHAPRSVRERSYSQLRRDIVKRQQWCDLAGLGFELNYDELQNQPLGGFLPASEPNTGAAFGTVRP